MSKTDTAEVERSAYPEASRWVSDYLAGVVKPGDSVLELGCGECEVLAPAARTFPEALFVGVHQGEISSRSLCLRSRLLPNVSLLRGEPDRLPFEDGMFDLVFCRFLLRLPLDLDALLLEIRRVCRRGGRVILQDLAGLPDPTRSMGILFDPDLRTVCDVFEKLCVQLFCGPVLVHALKDLGFGEVRMVVQPCGTAADSLDRLLWAAKIAAARPAILKAVGKHRVESVCSRFLEHMCRPQATASPIVCTVTCSRG